MRLHQNVLQENQNSNKRKVNQLEIGQECKLKISLHIGNLAKFMSTCSTLYKFKYILVHT